MDFKDYYKILGIGPNASQRDIKQAYREMAHRYHSDTGHGDDAIFREVAEAYNVLSDSQKRREYHRQYQVRHAGTTNQDQQNSQTSHASGSEGMANRKNDTADANERQKRKVRLWVAVMIIAIIVGGLLYVNSKQDSPPPTSKPLPPSPPSPLVTLQPCQPGQGAKFELLEVQVHTFGAGVFNAGANYGNLRLTGILKNNSVDCIAHNLQVVVSISDNKQVLQREVLRPLINGDLRELSSCKNRPCGLVVKPGETKELDVQFKVYETLLTPTLSGQSLRPGLKVSYELVPVWVK